MGIEYGERRSTFIDYGRPSLFLDFAKRKSLVDAISKNNLITFTRSSTGTYVGADGLIKTAAADEARFDYDPETGESLGLLIEEQRTNLIPFSENFGFGSQWNTIRATITQNQITAPDGTLTADLLEPIVTTFGGYTRFYYNVTSGTTYTFSFFAKYHSSDFPYVLVYAAYEIVSGSGRNVNYFNIQNGTLGSGSGSTYVSHSIKDYGNGWYRCSITTTADVTGSVPFLIFPAEGNNDISYVSDGVGGIYIWGAQLEQGSFPTSYIPTSGSTVTRQPDNAQITGTNFTDWYNATEGTIFTEFSAKTNTTGYPGVYWFNNNLTANRGFALLKETSPQTKVFQRGDDAVLKRVSFSENIPDSTFAKASVFYTNSEIGGSQNNQFQSPTSITSPYSVNRLYIGYHNSGGGSSPLYLNSHIKQLLYYPERLTNAQLQNLTK